MPYTEQELCLLVELLPGVGTKTILTFLENGHSIQDFFLAGRKKGLVVDDCVARQTLDDVASLSKTHALQLVTWFDSEYPDQLRLLADPPLFYFKKGALSLDGPKNVAIVGTRNPTSYGIAVAQKMTEILVQRGFTIVSGFMRGIDTVAHRSAIDNQAPTIAVMGSGFQFVVPPENIRFIPRLIEQGSIISEFLPWQKPTRYTFPKRNRLVAALSQAVIVVEAGAKSGALITARLAAEQNKDVMAVPGPIFSVQSAGCNWLIGQGANIVRSAEEIVELLGEDLSKSQKIRPSFESKLHELLYDQLQNGPQHVDELIHKINEPASLILQALSILEVHGHIKKVSPNTFMVD